jgi:DnaJ family protein A protein 2
MNDRQRIVLAGAGDQKVGKIPCASEFLVNRYLQPGIAPGDVIFVLNANAHESFERNGNDLLTHVTITLSEALLGFSRIILTHLDGRGIKFSSQPGKIIKPDDAIVLRGEGMPVHKQQDEKGNLYVMFEIEMPTSNWLMTADTKVRRLLYV